MTLKIGTLIFLLWLSISCGTAENKTDCKLKEQFQGRWFQNGFKHFFVEIEEKSFILAVPEASSMGNTGHTDFPGQCVDQYKEDYYIFHNPEGRHGECTTCVQIFGLHENALRYTKSICKEHDPDHKTLQQLCDSIGYPHEDELGPYYLFRADAPSINCPFQAEDHFQMDYTKVRDDKTKTCPHNLSTAQTCFNGTDMLLNYEACIDNVSAKKEKLSCIAVWKDGDRRFFVANIIVGKHLPSLDQVERIGYRCFLLENATKTTDVFKHKAAVSEEGTCNGLSDVGSGETSYTFYKSESCEFPRWFSSRQWHGLDHELTFTSRLHPNEPKKHTYSEIFKKTYPDAESPDGPSVQKLSCIRKVNNSNPENKNSFTIVTRISSPGCEFKVKCVILTRLTEDITLFESWAQSDKITYENFYKSCLKSPQSFDKEEFSYDERTLISKTGKNTNCTYPGVYRTNHISKHNEYTSETQSLCNATKFIPQTIRIGCDDPTQITIVHDNDKSCGIVLDKTSKCYGSWTRKGTEYLLINDPYHNSYHFQQEPAFLCVAISKDQGSDRISWHGLLGSCDFATAASNKFRRFLEIGMNKSESCHHVEDSDLDKNPFNESESQENGNAPSSGQRVISKILIVIFLLSTTHWLFFLLED